MDIERQLALLKADEPKASFASRMEEIGLHPLTADGITILQMNITRRCNLSCKHCHVEAGPLRNEEMDWETMEQCLSIAEENDIGTVDMTGGAPEMHPRLPDFLDRVVRPGRRTIVRSNLVILRDPKYAHYMALFARLGVEVVGSVADYRRERSERQRGTNTFDTAIEAIRELNRRGYGMDGTGLVLDLVHNPSGAYLPGGQAALEHEYRTRLRDEYGIEFNRLFCLTNCPVGRYLDYLVKSENLSDYMQSLRQAFNPAAAANVMCRTTLSVGWDGHLYDCDFNQMLGLRVNSGAPAHIRDFDFDKLRSRQIAVREHCFACAAGAGSSCQGALEP